MKVYDYYIWKKFGENLHEWSWLLAEDKDDAMSILEEELSLQGMLQWTPVRKNQKKDMYRLSLYEKWDIESYIKDKTKKNICTHCWRVFRKMTTKWYVDLNEWQSYRLDDDIFCSYNCAIDHKWDREILNMSYLSDWYGVIYKITHKDSNKCYIWQTIRSWTLRWWEHFTQWTAPKFQDAINCSELEHWTFEIIEKIPKEIVRKNPQLLTDLEAKWINHFNSIENWFNTKKETIKNI